MTLRHPLLFLALLAFLIIVNPLPWLVYWVELAIWNWHHGNPY